jgi:hypothetical protein
MTTLQVLPSAPLTTAHVWFTENLPELTRRAQVFARRFPRSHRDDAAARGKLARLTPFTLVSFFGRGYASGRRLAGTDTQDVLAPAVQQRHRLRVISLDETRPVRVPEGLTRLPLSEVLADKRATPPPENCRRDVDYAEILQRQRASRQAKRVFRWLAESHGTARGADLARRMRVSPPRIVQLKHQLADCLAAEDYGPPPTRPKWGRPRTTRRSHRRSPKGHVRMLQALQAGGVA